MLSGNILLINNQDLQNIVYFFYKLMYGITILVKLIKTSARVMNYGPFL